MTTKAQEAGYYIAAEQMSAAWSSARSAAESAAWSAARSAAESAESVRPAQGQRKDSMGMLRDRWVSARTRFYVECQKVDMKQALVMARGDWDYLETEELRSRLQKGETVTVKGKFGKRKTFSLSLIEASLGVRFLCASMALP